MKLRKTLLSLFLTTVLLICPMISGMVLPASASTDTFKLAQDTYYVSQAPSGYYVYSAVPALTLDGKPYTEALTWTTSNSEAIKLYSTETGLFYPSYGVANGSKSTLTATNAAGESHSCEVITIFDGEVISGGDFESVAANTTKWTKNIIKDGKSQIVVDPHDPLNHVLEVPAGTGISTSSMYYSLPVFGSTKYRLSFDIKGVPASSEVVYITNVTSGSGTKKVSPKDDTWTRYSYTFTTNESPNRSSVIAFGNKSTDGVVYFDNVSLTAIGSAESVTLDESALKLGIGDTQQLKTTIAPEGATYNRFVWTSSDDQVATVDGNGNITAVGVGTANITLTAGSLSATCAVTVVDDLLKVIADPALQHGSITSDAVAGEVQEDDIVTLTVTPDEGYMMVPGSLKYVLEDGSETRILNEVLNGEPEFGRQSAGDTFRFAMPASTATVTAEFMSTETQDFAVDTLGLSFHYTTNENGEKQYDGVRFLTRLQLANKFDDSTGTLTVKYNGTEYTLLELGSLLKRNDNDMPLTYDNAVANSEKDGREKMWISRAYTAEEGIFRVVDYTDSYLDFASVMMTGYKTRLYTARGYVRLQDANGNIVTLELSELSSSISAVDGKVEFHKTASHTESQTVSPGSTVTYSIELKNTAELPIPVTVTDVIPEIAEYADGCDDVSDNQMTWNVILPAGKTKTITYTLKAKDDEANLGKALDGVAKVDGYKAPCNKIYVERTLGKVDQQLMETAIDAFRQYTNLKNMDLLKMIWNVAMSKSVSYNDSNGAVMTPAQILNFIYTGEGSFGGSAGSGEEAATAAVDFRKAVIPTLFGGTGVTDDQTAQFNGTKATVINSEELMAGDTFFVQETENDQMGKIYIHNGERLFLIGEGVLDVNTDHVLASLPQSYRYVGLRHSFVMANRISFPDDRNDTLTDVQKATVAYAESMLLRGDRAQYDAGSTMKPSGRSEYKEYTPEQYTSNEWKYTNCAMLAFDSYYFGADKSCGSNWYTAQMISTAKSQNIYYYEPTATETEEEQQAQIDKFFSTLQPADTIVIRRKNSSGHAMLYTGNDIIIHSTGGSYLTADNSGIGTGVEQYEATVRYLNAHSLWEAKCDTGTAYTYYVFGGQITQIAIYRPLKSYSSSIPEESRIRMNGMKDIVIEKVASNTPGKTVNVGDNVTYTINLLNAGNEEKTLDITDTIPVGSTLVSAPNAVVNESDLAWKVTVPAGEKAAVTYTVSVGATDKLAGTTAVVGGISAKCADVFVANTLTAEQQETLIAAVKSLSGSAKRNLELVNEIYKTAFGVESNIFEHTTLSTLHSQMYEKKEGEDRYSLIDNAYGAMAAPTLCGGRNFQCTDVGKYGRQSRIGKEEDLVVGDILFGRTSSSNYVYIYLGDGVCWSLSTNNAETISVSGRLERFVGYVNYWTVFRPSMVLDV